MSIIVQGLTSHDCSGNNSCLNPSRCGEAYQELDIFKYNIDGKKYRQPYEGYNVPGGPKPLLY